MPTSQPPSAPHRLVLVEDSDGYAALIETLLAGSDRSPDLRRFARLDEALAHLAHVPADCVLLDLELPDAEGAATLARVLEVAPTVPVVILTGRADEALGVQLIRAGAQDYIVKGHEGGDVLPRAVRHAIERRRTGEREEVARLVREVAVGVGTLAAAPAQARESRRVVALAVAALVGLFGLQLALGIRLGGGVSLLYALPVAFAATTSRRAGLAVAALGVALGTLWGVIAVPDQLHPLAAAIRALALGAIALGSHRLHAHGGDRAQLLRAVMDSTSDAVFVRDLGGRFVMINAALAELLGRRPEEIIGRRPAELVEPEAAEVWVTWDEAVLASGTARRYWRTVPIRGAERTFSTVKAPLRDAAGAVAGIVGIARDETEVRRLEAESSRFFELAPDMLCTVHPDGRLGRVNPAWTTALGWSAEELRSRPIADFVHPRDRDRTREDLARLLRGEVDTCANRLATRSGGWRDIEWTARVAADGTAFAAARDVTERNTMARQLRAGETRYRTLAESLPGSAVLTFDHDLRFTFAAGEPLATLGLENRVVGRTLAEVIPDVAPRLTPRYRAALGGHDQSFEHVTAEGRALWVQITPLRDDDGAIIGGMVIIQDIDTLRRAEREVVRAEERFRAAFEQAPIGMALIGLDGRLQRVNEALSRALDLPPEELVGTPFTALVHPEDRAAAATAEAELLAGRVPVHAAEHRWLRPDGAELWAAVRAILVRDDAGNPTHVLAQIQDVTEPRRLQARLRHQADHDPLTGLLNRRCFETELNRHARRSPQGAVLLVDLDGFKEVNDHHGHAAGDELLVRVAGILHATLGRDSLVARLGGDEFAALIGAGGRDEAEQAADRLVQAVRQTAGADVTASVGVATFDDTGRTGELVLARADLALYAVKAAGRDGWGTVAAEPAA
jgi:diguanylate cyclase (GGDEF)-like protein/PAS domain S-box-containing protein